MFNSLLSVFAFAGDSIQNGWNGFYGNRSDYYLCAALRKLSDRLPPTTEPRNHLLQRALRKSYLESILLLCNDRLREIQPSGWRRFLSRHLKPDAVDAGGLWSEKLWEKLSPAGEKDRDELLWLCAVISAVNAERNSIDKSDKPIEFSAEIELFLQPRGDATIAQRVAEIRQSLQNDLLTELQFIGSTNADQLPNILPAALVEIPSRVRKMVEKGWIPYQPSESPLPLDGDEREWFQCFCGFFQQKLTGDVADVLQTRLLTRLVVGEDVPSHLQLPEAQTHALTFEIFQNELQKTGGAITLRLSLIEGQTGRIERGQNEALNKIDSLLPLIVTAENIAEVVNSLPDLIQREGRQTRQHISDELETTYRRSQEADETRHQEILLKLEENKRADSLKQSQAREYNPIPNPIPSAHDVFDRHGECQTLGEMLVAADARLIRIVAPSGYGKTKLVLKFLKSVEPQIGKRNGEQQLPADGVLLVNCKDRGNADVWNEILDRAGLMTGRREEFNAEIRGIQSPEGQAAHLLNMLEMTGRFWIVLDNFEDLLDKESGTIGRDADDPIRHLFHLLCTHAVNQRLIVTTQHVPAFVGKNAPLLSNKHLIPVGGTPETDAVNYLRIEGAEYLLDRIGEAALLDFVRRVDCLPLALVSLLRDLEKHFAGKPQGRVTVAEVEEIAASATHYIEADRENGLRLWLTDQIRELHADEQIVLSVLSVFAKPCPQIALEFILPNLTTVKIERLLARLERDKLIYQDGGGFQLSAIIRDAAYSLIPDGGDNERQ